MSPLTRKKSVSRSGWSIKGSNTGFKSKKVKVEVDDDLVIIGWFDRIGSCATRKFTADALRELIMYVDGPLTRYPDMWLNHQDSKDAKFYARLKDGMLTANVNPSENGLVVWEDLKHAFEEALAEIGHDDEEDQA